MSNDFLPFAVGGSANVTAQATYAANTTLTQNGFVAGIAKSPDLNKVWRQSSIMAAVLAQFITNTTGQNAVDDGTTATLIANLVAAVSAQSESIIGGVRNLAMTVSAASATATVTADEIIVGSALGGLKYTLPNFSKTINLATTGAGGTDTGVAPTSGYVALYAIYNPTTATAALLATNAATLQGNVYGGGNMPAGFTASALISVWPTNASKQFITGFQVDRIISFTSISVLSTSTTQASPTALSISAAVPPNARKVSGTLSASSTSTTQNTSFSVYATSTSAGIQGVNVSVGAAGGVANSFRDLPISVSQTIYYTANSGSGTPTYGATVTAYEI